MHGKHEIRWALVSTTLPHLDLATNLPAANSMWQAEFFFACRILDREKGCMVSDLNNIEIHDAIYPMGFHT